MVKIHAESRDIQIHLVIQVAALLSLSLFIHVCLAYLSTLVSCNTHENLHLMSLCVRGGD